MIKFELSEPVWKQCKECWKELKKDFIHGSKKEQAEYLHKTLFGEFSTDCVDITNKTKLPSPNEMSQLMNEIDNEAKNNDDDVISKKIQEVIKINRFKTLTKDQTLIVKTFIREPV